MRMPVQTRDAKAAKGGTMPANADHAAAKESPSKMSLETSSTSDIKNTPRADPQLPRGSEVTLYDSEHKI